MFSAKCKTIAALLQRSAAEYYDGFLCCRPLMCFCWTQRSPSRYAPRQWRRSGKWTRSMPNCPRRNQRWVHVWGQRTVNYFFQSGPQISTFKSWCPNTRRWWPCVQGGWETVVVLSPQRMVVLCAGCLGTKLGRQALPRDHTPTPTKLKLKVK